MWIFAPLGLLMPAAIPAEKVDPKYLGPDGDFDVQVRARVESHLTNFIRDYVTPLGLEISEIQHTPEMDYNCRFYMRKRDLAVAVGSMVLDIDYKKFKPTAEDKDEDGTLKYEDGVEYHSVLNSIWGAVCRLGRPGGSWGPYSATNPNGYKPGKYTPGAWTAGRRWRDTAWGRGYAAETALDDQWLDEDFGPTLLDEIGMRVEDEYVPDIEDRKNDILLSVEGLPTNQWDDWLSAEEMYLIRDEFEEFRALEKRERKSRRRRFGRRRSKV